MKKNNKSELCYVYKKPFNFLQALNNNRERWSPQVWYSNETLKRAIRGPNFESQMGQIS